VLGAYASHGWRTCAFALLVMASTQTTVQAQGERSDMPEHKGNAAIYAFSRAAISAGSLDGGVYALASGMRAVWGRYGGGG